MRKQKMHLEIEPVRKAPSQEVALYKASKLLGHKEITTTPRYAHLELEHLKEATNKVAEVFG